MFGALAGATNREVVVSPNERKRVRGETDPQPAHDYKNRFWRFLYYL